MPNVQVRNVPEEVHSVLVRRASRAGQSLQQYLSEHLSQMSLQPTIEELTDRIEAQRLGRFTREDTVAAIEADRARH